MEKRILNYRVIIEPDERTGTDKPCYSAYVPTLGVATDGNTMEDALKNVKEAILLYVESLIEEKAEIPQDKTQEYLVATTTVRI